MRAFAGRLRASCSVLVGSLAAVGLMAASAAGQYGGYVGSATQYPYGYGEEIATTPIQGIDYGVARIIRAEADWNLAASKAALNWTEVQRQEMQNYKDWTATYFEVRRMWREFRAAERGRQPTAADFVRYAQMGKPRRLTPSELDPISGQLGWPMLLRNADFAIYRMELDQVFADRAARGVIGGEQYLRANRLADSMLEALRRHIYEVPPGEYMLARRFLESVSYEVQVPAT
jgi:hypothetical protein